MDLVVILIILALIFGVEKYQRAKASQYVDEQRRKEGKPPFDWKKYE